jgi:hypothetical protein
MTHLKVAWYKFERVTFEKVLNPYYHYYYDYLMLLLLPPAPTNRL